MNPSQLADLLGVAPNTIRRWSKVYAEFLTPAARPQRGHPRRFSRFDQRVLYFVAALRQNKPDPIDEEQIVARLKSLQGEEWNELPELPPEFGDIEDSKALEVIPTEQRARELVTMEYLQRENQLLEVNLQVATERAEKAEQKVSDLQTEINNLRVTGNTEKADLQNELHAAQLELQTARGEVSALQARLASYSLRGDHPVPLVVLLAVTALAVAILVIVLLVVVRLVM